MIDRKTARRLVLFAFLAVAAATGAGGYYGFWRYHLKRLQAVHPGVFYRVAQPTEWGLDYLVRRQGVRTVLSLQLFDPQLDAGLCDPGDPDGAREAQYTVDVLGARHVQFPMGQETYWPWLTPWQFEEFFRLLDEPKNRPVAVHCAGGRHRTGTLSALFRLEYDRWPVDRVLAEMYSFHFGAPIAVQEYNLRTYLPRPHPNEDQWATLGTLREHCSDDTEIAVFEQLVHVLRQRRGQKAIEENLKTYIESNQPFALPLAQRLIDDPSDPLTEAATKRAARVIDSLIASAADWQMAAALIADFGDTVEQQQLLERIMLDSRGAEVSPRYAAIVAGVENRYTRNRLAYLRPVLDDERLYGGGGARGCRYCDAALARISAITNQLFIIGPDDRAYWDYSCSNARRWLDTHREQLQLGQLVAPDGNNPVLAGNGRAEEDAARLRR